MQEREERRMEERKCVGWQGTGDISPVFRCAGGAGQAAHRLRQVFEDLSVDLGRKPNSIRNYYYACLRNQEQNTPRVQAFIPFTEAETHDLLRQVLTGCGQGMSVRAYVMRMADGDHSRMLRYQNKYRAILKHHPEMIAQVRQELLAEGVAAPAQGKNPPDEAENRAASQMMAEPCVLKMLEGMNFRQTILHIAALLPVQRIANAFQARPHLPNQLHSRVIIFLPRNPPQILLHAHSIERTLQLLLFPPPPTPAEAVPSCFPAFSARTVPPSSGTRRGSLPHQADSPLRGASDRNLRAPDRTCAIISG